MKSFREYLEHVDPEHYGVEVVDVDDDEKKEEWTTMYESSPDCGWDAFEGNQNAVDDYVDWITRRR